MSATAIIGGVLSAASLAAGVGMQARREKRLSGAEKELLQWNKDQAIWQWQRTEESALEAYKRNSYEAQLTRDFNAREAQLVRDWQERMYLQYESPEALIRQYQDAGLNPALMYGSASPGSIGGSSPASASPASSPSGSASLPSSALPSRNMDYIRMFAELAMLDSQIKNVQADTAQKTSQAELISSNTVGQNLENEFNKATLVSRIDIVDKELRQYDDQHAKVLQDINLSKSQQSQIIENTKNIIVERATEHLKQKNIEITNEKLSQEIILLQIEEGLKILEKQISQKNLDSISLDNEYKDWQASFRNNVGMSPDQPIWNAVVSILGTFSQKAGNALDSAVNAVKNWFK